MTNDFDFKKYYEICQKFYSSNVIAFGIDFNSFYDDVCKAAIEEATKTKGSNYPPDRRFTFLLKNRYTDYHRNLKKQNMKSTSDNQIFDKSIMQAKDFHTVRISSDTIATTNTPLGKSIILLNDLIDNISEINMNDKTIGTKFQNISEMYSITHFLTIPIDKIVAIYEAKSNDRQSKYYHLNRFEQLLNNYENKIPKTFTQLSDDGIDDDGIDKNAKYYVKRGFDARDQAELVLNKAKVEKDAKSFFVCFLLFLKASILFKKAIVLAPNYITAIYNHAFVLKRLGFFTELNNLIKKDLPEETKSLVFECLGDTHLLQGELKKALKCFKVALKLTPNDQEVNFNILQTYYELDEINSNNDNFTNIHNTLEKLLTINKPTQKTRFNLLNRIIHKYNQDVAEKALKVNKLK